MAPPAKGFMAMKARPIFWARGRSVSAARFYEIERELDGDELSRGDGLQSRGDAVGRDADEPDLPLPPGFQRCAESSAGSDDGLPVLLLDDLVELEKIDIVGLHSFQAEVNMLCHAFSVPVLALGGDEDFLANAGQG